MSRLSQARSAAGQLDRASEIATVLWSSGFSWAVHALGLRSCVSLGCRTMCASGLRQCHHHVAMDQPLPVRMRLKIGRSAVRPRP